jgi:hypothetical protein
MFVDLNTGRWVPDPPAVDDAEARMFALAARSREESALADWLRDRVVFRR